MTRRKLIAGNWKMNGLKADGIALATAVANKYKALADKKFDCLLLRRLRFWTLLQMRQRIRVFGLVRKIALNSKRAHIPVMSAR